MNLPESKLKTLRANTAHSINALSDALSGPTPPQERERLWFELSRQHRLAGIAALLREADVGEFRRHLGESARARAALLRLPRAGAAPSRYRCASQLDPTFDGIVARESALTSEIAWLSPSEWTAGEEYQEDFLYARCIHALALGTRGPELEGKLSALQRLFESEGGTDMDRARLAACEAIHRADAPALDEALRSMLELRAADFRERERALLPDPLRHHAEKSVFVEGLALVELARARGLSLDGEYPTMPGMAWRSQGPGART